jgi:CBS domain-containing protein
MNVSSIAVRIADFLSKYPPFSYLPESELRSLAAKGRVRFYEDGELIFDQGGKRNPWIYVVQQGRVRISLKQDTGETLVDYRGSGDLLGLEGLVGDEPYHHFAMTETEVMLYLLPRDMLVELLQNNEKASRYLSSCFSLNPYYEIFQDGPFNRFESQDWLDKDGFKLETYWQKPRSCKMTDSIQVIAQKLSKEHINLLLITNEKGEPLGYVDDSVIRQSLAEGVLDVNASVNTIMKPIPVCISRHATIGDILLKLLQFKTQFACVTKGGAEDSEVLGVITEGTLDLSYGAFPHTLGKAISEATDVETLKILRKQMDHFMSGYLGSRMHFPWLLDVVATLNKCLISRCIELAWDKLVRERNLRKPNLRWCFLLFGSGGRNELTVRSDQDTGIIYENPSPENEQEVQEWFLELGQRVTDMLDACGLKPSVDGMTAANPRWCNSELSWERVFRHFVLNPMEHDSHSMRLLFDFQPIYGTLRLGYSLHQTVNHTIQSSPEFIRLMARAAMFNLPPRTVFKDTLIGSKNEQTMSTLEIVQQTITPLVDVARIFSFQHRLTATSTSQRLRDVGHITKHSNASVHELFLEASEAFRLALYFRTIVGVREENDGNLIALEAFEPEEREQLKNIFRTTLRLMEYLAKRYDLEFS